MSFPGRNYAPPGVYTQTQFENPLSSALESLKIPVIVGEGSESLFQQNLELVRGSSAVVDVRVVDEDQVGHAVVSQTSLGVVTLGAFNGVADKFQVTNWPIVTGDGTGTATTNRTDVSVTINGEPVVVRMVDGAHGIVQLATVPLVDDVVRCTYYFDRSDTVLTDDVSAQVPNRVAAIHALSGLADVNAPNSTSATLDIHGDILDSLGVVLVAANNVLNLTVDGTARTIVLPARSNYTMLQIATAITAARAGTLTGSTFVNQYGHSALLLQSDHSVSVQDGSANGLLGLIAGLADNRVSTFYVFQGPIVTGDGSGTTTTDVSHVVVRLNGRQVIPASVDGASRAVTLTQAPKAGDRISIQYYWNTWQDTFDYLAHSNITQITQCGTVAGANDYVQGADFILQNDRIMWGTAATVDAGINTVGYTTLDNNQITTTLVDNRTFLAECTSVVGASGGIATESRLEFLLPLSPTLGNGRDTPLGQSLFQTISNSRIDLPVNRPDVVWAYWGFDVQDAVQRGRVDVLKVDGNVLTLAEAVPVGAKVYATFYYNLISDETYTLSCLTAGTSGMGQYTITDSGGNDVYGASMVVGSKGAGLTGITLEFPSGSELSPDFHFEAVDDTLYAGPAEELVTVRFGSRVATPAKYTVSGASPFAFISGQSDHLRVKMHGYESVGTTGLNLASPSAVTTHTGGYFASLVGEELEYAGGSPAVVGQSVVLTADEEFTVEVDSVPIPVVIPAATTAVDATYFVSRINDCASGHKGLAQAGSTNDTLVMQVSTTPTAEATADDYYVGWKVVIGYSVLAGAAVGGQVRTITAYSGATNVATVDSTWDTIGMGPPVITPPVLNQPYYVYNPATVAEYTGSSRFNGPITIAAGDHDALRLVYTGSTSAALSLVAANTAILTPGTYATPAALATEVTTQIAAQVLALITAGSDAHKGLIITCTANVEGQLVFSMQLPGTDNAGVLQFVNAASAPADFAVLAGIDTASAVELGQAALVQGPIARAYECPASGANKPFDRIILRNRLLPGGGGSQAADFVVSKTQLEILVGSTTLGLLTGAKGLAGSAAVVHPATLFGSVGILGGQETGTAEPLVTFYDGTGTPGANNVFAFELDSIPVTVTFTASAGGTATPLGPVGTAGTIVRQIALAMEAIPGAPWGNLSAIIAANLVRQEGVGIRITGTRTDEQSRLVIGSGSANGLLGFGAGTTSLRTLVETRKLASALMSHHNSTFVLWTLTQAFPVGDTFFAKHGIASVIEDDTGAEYLYLQDAPTLAADLGSGSSVALKTPSPNVKNAFFYGTGLVAEDGEGATGEAALDGYFVTSSLATGSGSANTSVLNDGVGQDGIVGQTYADRVTGLTFTILPRGWSTDKTGPWTSYPTGATATFRIRCSKTFTCDANIPVTPLLGLEMKMANTVNVAVGDTAIVQTFERSGNEPAIGDLYYTSYVYTKQDFTTQFFTKMSAVEKAYGAPIPDNPVSLAAYLAMLNGAMLVGVKQVQKEAGVTQASLVSYRSAIEELEGVLPGFVTPDVITLMRGDSTDLYQVLKRSCDKMSSIRYRSERTAVLGMAAGSLPKDVIALATTLVNTRMRLVYPDMAIITIQDNLGTTKEYLIDGPYVAAALTGSVVSPNLDVATPWTGRRLVGFTQLARKLDAVEMNLIAQKGVTILEDKPPYLRVRHGLTTDMTNTLTKLPTIILIADEVQRQARGVLENFIGIKFLPGVLSQIEGRLAMMFKQLVSAQIISAYTGVKATVSADDPTTSEVEAYYSPVFPLLYIVCTFHVRSSL